MASRAGAISISRRWAADTYVAWRPLLKNRPARSPPNTKELGSLLDANRHLWKGRDRTEVMACLQMLVYRGVFAKESCATAMFGRLPSNSMSADALPINSKSADALPSKSASADALLDKTEPRGGQRPEAAPVPPLPAEPSPGLDGLTTPSNPVSTGALQGKAESCDSRELDAETGLPPAGPSPRRQSALPHESTSTDALRDKAEPCDSWQPDAAPGRPPAEPPVDSSHPGPNTTRASASSSSPHVGDSSSSRASPPIPRVAISADAPSLVEGEIALLYMNFGHLFATAPRNRPWKFSEIKQFLRQSPVSLESLAVEPADAIMDLLRQNVFHSEEMARAIFPWLSRSVISAYAHRWSTLPAVSPSPGPSSAGIANAVAAPEDLTPPWYTPTFTSPAERDKSDRLMRGEAGHRVPFKSQHVILNAAQEALEGSCFDWSGRALPRLIRMTGWDCPAAGELNRWVSLFAKDSEASRLLSSAAEGPENLWRILLTMGDLRQVTVHRHPLTSQQISKHVHTAADFARLLEDGQRAPQLERVACELDRRLRIAEGKAAGPVADLETIRQTRAKVDKEKELDRLEVVQDAFRRNTLGGENEDEYAAACFDLLNRHEKEFAALDRKERATKKKMTRYRRWESHFLGGSLEEFVLGAFGKALPVEFQRTPHEAAEPSDGIQGDGSPAAAHAGVGRAEAQG